jgi:hypothetical protein
LLCCHGNQFLTSHRIEVSQFTLHGNFARFSPKLLQALEITLDSKGNIDGALQQKVLLSTAIVTMATLSPDHVALFKQTVSLMIQSINVVSKV